MKFNPDLELKWLSVDFDGTLAFTSPPSFSLEDAKPNMELIEVLRRFVDEGKKIVVYTSRHWQDYQEIESWLIDNSVPFKQIICGKPLCWIYIDDRAIPPETFIKNHANKTA